MHATKELPEGYTKVRELDLSRPLWRALLLQLAATLLFGVGAVIFYSLARWLRPDGAALPLSEKDLLATLLLGVPLMLVLHEGIHGLLFWWVTRERPRFGLSRSYAYAAAPEWYIPRDQYIWIGLGPLLGISALGAILIPLVPHNVLLLVLIIAIINFGGAIGDIVMVFLVWRRPATTLVQDTGDAIVIYDRGSGTSYFA